MKVFLRTVFVVMLSASIVFGAVAQPGSEKSTREEVDENFNALGYPIVDEPIVMSMMVSRGGDPRQNLEINAYFDRMAALTNVSWDFIQVAANNYSERKNLAFASGDLPDVFYGEGSVLTSQEEMGYGEQGLLLPLEDLIQEYAPNLRMIMATDLEVSRGITTPTGHVYGFPRVNKQRVTIPEYVNTVWLDVLELDVPRDLDDLYEVLVAFRDGDPNGNGIADEIPMTMHAGWGFEKRFLAHWGVFFNDSNVFVDDEGEVVFAPLMPEFREGLSYLNRLYTEGLLDSEALTQSAQDAQAKGRSEDELYGYIFFAPFWLVGEARDTNFTPVVPPLKGPDGELLYTGDSHVTRAHAAITSENDHPEATVRWIDHQYSEEGAELAWLGVEGVDYERNADGTFEFLVEEGQEQYDVRYPQTFWGGAGILPQFWFDGMSNPQEKAWVDSIFAASDYRRQPFPLVYVQPEDQRRTTALNTDISAYVDQMIARFTTGDASLDDDWAEYEDALDRMGVEELVTIMQKVYDEYWANK